MSRMYMNVEYMEKIITILNKYTPMYISLTNDCNSLNIQVCAVLRFVYINTSSPSKMMFLVTYERGNKKIASSLYSFFHMETNANHAHVYDRSFIVLRTKKWEFVKIADIFQSWMNVEQVSVRCQQKLRDKIFTVLPIHLFDLQDTTHIAGNIFPCHIPYMYLYKVESLRYLNRLLICEKVKPNKKRKHKVLSTSPSISTISVSTSPQSFFSPSLPTSLPLPSIYTLHLDPLFLQLYDQHRHFYIDAFCTK